MISDPIDTPKAVNGTRQYSFWPLEEEKDFLEALIWCKNNGFETKNTAKSQKKFPFIQETLRRKGYPKRNLEDLRQKLRRMKADLRRRESRRKETGRGNEEHPMFITKPTDYLLHDYLANNPISCTQPLETEVALCCDELQHSVFDEESEFPALPSQNSETSNEERDFVSFSPSQKRQRFDSEESLQRFHCFYTLRLTI